MNEGVEALLFAVSIGLIILFITTKYVVHSMLKESRLGIPMSEMRIKFWKPSVNEASFYNLSKGVVGIDPNKLFVWSGEVRKPNPGEYFLLDGRVIQNVLDRPWFMHMYIMVEA